MSYQPLHHKYRPQTFADLVGQEAIATTLTNALRQQRIAPAYLFTGARGTGKTSSARIMAKSLNCLSRDVPTDRPCGSCEVCRAIANGSALDVIEIDAASNTGVDNIRELIERSQFAPVQCRYKVYVIDECHMLSTAAFNALLKTLEEPPDRVVFVLATTDPQRVLPTIISRCQRFDYRRIPLDAMVKHLKTIAAQEAIAITDAALTLVSQLAQGGLRDAESLLDQLSLLPGEITVEQVWDLVGAVPERDLLGLLAAIAAADLESLLDNARRLMDRGREPLIVLQNLASFYRDLLIAKSAPDRPDLVALTAPTWASLCEFAQKIELPTILTGQQHLRSCEAQVKNSTQPRLWLEVALMGLLPGALPTAAPTARVVTPPVALAHPAAIAQPSPLGEQPQTLSAPSPSPAPEAAIAPVAPPASATANHPAAPGQSPPALSPPSASLELNQIWQQVLSSLHPLSKALLAEHGRLLAFDGHEAHLGISSDKLLKIAQNQVRNIEKAFLDVFQQTVRVTLEVAALPSPTSTNAPSPLPKPSQGYSAIDAQPNAPSVKESGKGTEAWSPPRDRPPATEPSAGSHAVTPQVGWQGEDELAKASKQLADFFAGRIVDLDAVASGAIADVPPLADTSEIVSTLLEKTATIDEELDDDIPF